MPPHKWRKDPANVERGWESDFNVEQSKYWRWRAGAYKGEPTANFRLPGEE
jgi:hypothetical protein